MFAWMALKRVGNERQTKEDWHFWGRWLSWWNSLVDAVERRSNMETGLRVQNALVYGGLGTNDGKVVCWLGV